MPLIRESNLSVAWARAFLALMRRGVNGISPLFIEVAGIEKVYSELKSRVKVTMPLEKKWYGVTEFAFEDPDRYVITFAERK